MKKRTTSFVCQDCGYDTPQWLGRCPECGAWNSLKEIILSPTPVSLRSQASSKQSSSAPKNLNEIHYDEKQRISTGFIEMDTVLGGGIVSGSVALLAGDPGIGKSTLLLQTGLFLAKHNTVVLYISGEESEGQVKLRAKRILGKEKESENFLLLSTNDTDHIATLIQETKPQLVIIDSIQTMESQNAGGMSGSVGQVRYATAVFIRVAKTMGIPMLLIGHVTKEGMVAGPMLLSHMVDTVLFLEGEKNTTTRILRSFKNRFGPVDEVGIFTMVENGMSEIANPQQLFLARNYKPAPGSVYVATLEGTRAFLVEIQALVVFSKLPLPRRVASGVDPRRLELLLAVLQKQINLPVGNMDVFINVAGGLKISDRASDLGICLAVFSSLQNKSLIKTVSIAEVGLLGELRAVPLLEKRIKEAKKLGFHQVISTKTHTTLQDVIKGIK